MEAVAGNPVLKTIDLTRIDEQNRFFKVTFESYPSKDSQIVGTDALKASIARIGLLSPPFLKSQPDERYSIVSGFKRVMACRDLGWRSIPAWVMENESDAIHLMKLAVADNALNRSLNVIEQATAIFKLSPFLPDDDRTWTAECAPLGLTVNPGLIWKLKKIHFAPGDLKEKMAAGKISLTVGLELVKMDDTSRILFLSIFESLNPTLNHQKEMIRLAFEIAGLEDEPISEIFNRLDIESVIKDPDMDRNLKISLVRQKLKNRRYPEISRFEKIYQDRIKRLKLPESIALNPPADFEGNDFRIQLMFRDSPQFGEICDALSVLREQPDFRDILDKKSEDY